MSKPKESPPPTPLRGCCFIRARTVHAPCKHRAYFWVLFITQIQNALFPLTVDRWLPVCFVVYWELGSPLHWGDPLYWALLFYDCLPTLLTPSPSHPLNRVWILNKKIGGPQIAPFLKFSFSKFQCEAVLPARHVLLRMVCKHQTENHENQNFWKTSKSCKVQN